MPMKPARPGSPDESSAIQRFFLYGHAEQPFDDRFMHCERIEGQLPSLDWSAKPHIHAGLHQLHFFERGGGELLVEDAWQSFRAPLLMLMPAGAVHGFRFTQDTEGWVVTASVEFVDEVMSIVDKDVQPVLDQARVVPLTRALAARHGLAALFGLVEQDYLGAQRGRGTALACALALALVKVARLAMPEHPEPTSERSPYEAPYRRFRDHVEAHYRQQPAVADIASALGMGVGRLTTVCRTMAGATPQEILHARLLAEAKRLLLYTGGSSSSVAYTLGFKDPAYFSRFFRRGTGKTPVEFRNACNTVAAR